MAPRTLLIPALLDDWFPLLQYAFASDRWSPVLLTEDTGLADLGLRYIHSDLCYPAHLVTGQILAAAILYGTFGVFGYLPLLLVLSLPLGIATGSLLILLETRTQRLLRV